MGILNLKKKTATTAVAEAPKRPQKLAVVDASKKPAVVAARVGSFDSSVIIRPRVTEKATVLSEKDGRTVVVFEVSGKANKRNVADAVRGLYKVTPEKIAVLRVPPKTKFVRGRMSKGTTGYKAYVYLKKEDKIEVA